MIQATAINTKKPEPMMVTWDLGRRCNYDCTYCAASRHNNYSTHASLDELKDTFNFIKEWTGLYNSKKKESQGHVNIDFTGGEPTINPNFWKLVQCIKEENQGFNVGLTTNGTWPEKQINKISKWIDGITISWHAESTPHLKQRVLNNILLIKEQGIWLQVNVMLHCDYFEEAKEVCRFLKEHNVKYNPVPIGDGTIARAGWFEDEDGVMRRTSHAYTKDQQEWFWNEVGVTEVASQETQGTEVGRKCCGGRCLEGKVNDTWQPIKLVENKFFGWQCMIDWFFMHVDQETGNVFHHQTCQARHDGTTGPIGNLSNTEVMLSEARERLKNPKAIVCPNQRCGCGMCIPKAKDPADFDIIWTKTVE